MSAMSADNIPLIFKSLYPHFVSSLCAMFVRMLQHVLCVSLSVFHFSLASSMAACARVFHSFAYDFDLFNVSVLAKIMII